MVRSKAVAGGGDRPTSDSDLRREGIDELIKSVATELFATRGYRSTTMSDIGERIGIRGPSLYKHLRSKHDLLADIMTRAMERALRFQSAAVESSRSPRDRLRRLAEAHARFHCRHRYEAFIGNREIDNLTGPDRAAVIKLRKKYEQTIIDTIEEGRVSGAFSVRSSGLATFAILDMGKGISSWYHEGGGLTEEEIAFSYGDYALHIVGAGPDLDGQ
jgi:AcrR family transcriptional regulator